MTTTTAVQRYQLQGNPTIPTSIIGNLLYDEIGEEAVADFNQAFPLQRDRHQYQKGEPLEFSNTLRNAFYHLFLQTHARTKGMRVLSSVEAVRDWKAIPDKATTYADFRDIPLFPNPGPNENLRKQVLALFDRTDTKVPLRVSGLKPIAASGEPGFTFERTEFSEINEAPYLRKSGKVRYDPKVRDLVEAKDDEEGVQIWVPEDQSGLRWACRGGGDGLDFGGDSLLGSDADGRVQVIQDPEGRAENLDALVNALRQEQETQLSEIKARSEQAMRFLRTGRL